MPRRIPSQARSRKKVANLLDAAALVLAERGYAGASTARIADRAGCSVGSLYEYFEDKDALLVTLGEREADAALERVGAAFPPASSSVHDQLRRFCLVLAGETRRTPRLRRALLDESPPDAAFLRLADAFEAGLASLLEDRLGSRPDTPGLRTSADALLIAVTADRLVRHQVDRFPEPSDAAFAGRTARLLSAFVRGGAPSSPKLGLGGGAAW